MSDTIPLDAPQGNIVYIYTLTSPLEPDHIRYVGKSNNPQKRFQRHLRDKHDTYKARWIRSLLAQNVTPILQIIEIVPEEKWREREIFWIAFYRSHGHNLTNTAEGGLGVTWIGKHTDEAKAKMSLAKIGIKLGPMSDEQKRHIAESKQGKKRPPEVGIKVSLAKRGKPLPKRSPESVARSTNKRRGQKRSAETRAKLVLAWERRRARNKLPPEQLPLWKS